MFRKLYYSIFKCYKRLELIFVTYQEADRLLKANDGKLEKDKWVLAKEEDANHVIGMAYLERKERIK